MIMMIIRITVWLLVSLSVSYYLQCIYKLFKKRKGTLGQEFFSARVVDLWNELDDSTVSVDNVTALF